jgi:hypothetical protein
MTRTNVNDAAKTFVMSHFHSSIIWQCVICSSPQSELELVSRIFGTSSTFRSLDLKFFEPQSGLHVSIFDIFVPVFGLIVAIWAARRFLQRVAIGLLEQESDTSQSSIRIVIYFQLSRDTVHPDGILRHIEPTVSNPKFPLCKFESGIDGKDNDNFVACLV